MHLRPCLEMRGTSAVVQVNDQCTRCHQITGEVKRIHRVVADGVDDQIKAANILELLYATCVDASWQTATVREFVAFRLVAIDDNDFANCGIYKRWQNSMRRTTRTE